MLCFLCICADRLFWFIQCAWTYLFMHTISDDVQCVANELQTIADELERTIKAQRVAEARRIAEAQRVAEAQRIAEAEKRITEERQYAIEALKRATESHRRAIEEHRRVIEERQRIVDAQLQQNEARFIRATTPEDYQALIDIIDKPNSIIGLLEATSTVIQNIERRQAHTLKKE